MRSALGASGRHCRARGTWSERDVYRRVQDWCLRTYGDSGKTKTVTRKKYGSGSSSSSTAAKSSSTRTTPNLNSGSNRGFQLGQPDEEVRGAAAADAKQVLYVPVKTTVSDSPSSVVCRSSPAVGVGGERGSREPPLARFAPTLLNPLPKSSPLA